MKKYIILITCIVLFPILFSSCLESYLDKSPEAGLTSNDVFKNLDNFKKFFLAIYEGTNTTTYEYNIKMGFPFYMNQIGVKYTWEGLTDCADQGRVMNGQTIKGGLMASTLDGYTRLVDSRPVLAVMFKLIRICNMTLENIHLLEADQVIIDDYTAQAHFVRAFAHFELFRLWGPMPYIVKVIGPEDQWDIPRLSKHETLLRIAADMDTAATFFAKAGLMRRDNPVPGAPGHLSNPEQARPNGVAAKAYKSRALLYAASPLNNELGIKDWEAAAIAAWEAIVIARQYGYDLLTAAKYKENYIGLPHSNEHLWSWDGGKKRYNDKTLASFINGVFSSSASNSGECPTQNFVDKFETKYGDPLNTQAERDAATAAGHYKEQDPYVNRDPRFYIDIIYNQATNIVGWTNSKAQIYYEIKNGVVVYSELLNQTYPGITHTGYYSRKCWGEQSVKNNLLAQYSDPLIRLGELYLNYAEAANEAYGPNGSAPGASLNALQALNLIRARIGHCDVPAQFTVSTEALRPRIRNERNVELSFEGHYYHDLRRWKDAPVAYAGPLMGVDIEKVPVSATYPTGFKYTRLPLPSDRQSKWKNAMYYFPFELSDIYKMKNFTQAPNESW
ncbi:MAG: RagB/SusD family nutrient uptake outer membrane protein [Bacteroidia bacterium]|nr:RagB/SusD family nutrient uptake outer membrane protein [Bacteroidia bacterium]